MFTEEQRQAITAHLADAQTAVLSAIARQAARTDSYDGPRNVARRTQALSVLRLTAGGGVTPGWFAYEPDALADEGVEFGL